MPEQTDFMPPEFFLDEEGDRVSAEEYKALGLLYGVTLVHLAKAADPGGASFHELFSLALQSSKTLRSISYDNNGRSLSLVIALLTIMERREVIVCTPPLSALPAPLTASVIADVLVEASERIIPAFWFIHEHYLPALLWLAQGEAAPQLMQGRLPTGC